MYQNTVIVGNLGKKPEMRYLPTGNPVTNFSVAVTETWKDKLTGEKQSKTTWFAVDVWGTQAESANQYLSKGSKVLVEGTVSVEAWTGRDGKAGATLKLRAETVRFLDSKSDHTDRVDSTPEDEPAKEDIPF